jgi:hypothetical protein
MIALQVQDSEPGLPEPSSSTKESFQGIDMAAYLSWSLVEAQADAQIGDMFRPLRHVRLGDFFIFPHCVPNRIEIT